MHPYPISGMDLPRYSGMSTFMRLPHIPIDQIKDITYRGVPSGSG